MLDQTINSLFELKKVTPEELLDEPGGVSPTSRDVEIYDSLSSHPLQRGQAFFEKVYGKVSKRVMGQMDRSGTEDLGLMARLMYGYIISNTKVLTATETSFTLIAGLIPQDVGGFSDPSERDTKRLCRIPTAQNQTAWHANSQNRSTLN